MKINRKCVNCVNVSEEHFIKEDGQYKICRFCIKDFPQTIGPEFDGILGRIFDNTEFSNCPLFSRK